MSRKGRPDKDLLRINGNRANLTISLKDFTVVFKKLKDKFDHFKSTDKESKKESPAELNASKNR